MEKFVCNHFDLHTEKSVCKYPYVITFGLHTKKSVCNVYLHTELNLYVKIGK